MDFSRNEDHEAIRAGVAEVVRRFGDAYWLERDDDGRFPAEFHRAMAEALLARSHDAGGIRRPASG